MLVQTRERIIRAFYELEKVKHIEDRKSVV